MIIASLIVAASVLGAALLIRSVMADTIAPVLAQAVTDLQAIVAQLTQLATNIANLQSIPPADVQTAQGIVTRSLTGVQSTLAQLVTQTGGGVQGPPVITLLNPGTGPAAGGTPVMVKGSGMTGATAVLFGTVPATGLTLGDDTELSCTSPAGTDGTVSVTVVTPVGTSAGSPFIYAN